MYWDGPDALGPVVVDAVLSAVPVVLVASESSTKPSRRPVHSHWPTINL
jgi:hypothetical protein